MDHITEEEAHRLLRTVLHKSSIVRSNLKGDRLLGLLEYDQSKGEQNKFQD